ncbi:pkinase-domain-containing protein [Lichtheimia corymbifera JMRC:FSU:9682]|uniref:Pkinase-domain-containing protein n=1 Tax=Lichtheimia corymbifera JMRC:FSU:9682 TaxID=1263082 RepID=A0A068RSI1_9FUNG|nr:pkinase-domain-containing protein [Lichtheimia corymbifera JMRC:FSU:9682]
MMPRSTARNQKAKLAADYNELLKELSSTEMSSVGYYRLGETIGQGTFGKVKLGTHQLTGQKVAVKKISKQHAPMIAREIHHHRQLRHPNIVNLYEIIVTESSIYVVSEYCPNGELFDALATCGRCPEHYARKWFSQLASAIKYCHEQGIVHRDLKLENILLDENDNAKICDFGFARQTDNRQLLETFCGSLAYSAPEIIERKKYTGPETDIWSLGVILYTLLAGELPFDDDSEIMTQRKIVKGVYEMPFYFSTGSADLIRSMLQKEPSQRITIDQILAHPWLQEATSSEATDDWITNASLTRNSSQCDLDSVFSGKHAAGMDEDDGCTDLSSYDSYSSLCEKTTMQLDNRLCPPSQESATASKFSPQVRHSLGMLRHDDMKRNAAAAAPRSPRFSAPSTMNIKSPLSPPSSPLGNRSSMPSTLPSSFINSLCDVPRNDVPSMTANEQHLAVALTAAGVDSETIKEMRKGTCDSLNGLWTMLLEKSSAKYAKEGFATVLQRQQQQNASRIPIQLPTKYATSCNASDDSNQKAPSSRIKVDATTQTTDQYHAASTTTPSRHCVAMQPPSQPSPQQQQQRRTMNNVRGGGTMPINNHSPPEKQAGWFSATVKALFVGSNNESERHQRRGSRTFRNVDAPPSSNGSSRKRYWDDSDHEQQQHQQQYNGKDAVTHRNMNHKYRLHMLQFSDPPAGELDQISYSSEKSCFMRQQDHRISQQSPHASTQHHSQRQREPLIPPMARTIIKPDTGILPLMTETDSSSTPVNMREKRYSTMPYRPSITDRASEEEELVCVPPIAASALSTPPPCQQHLHREEDKQQSDVVNTSSQQQQQQRPPQIVTPLSPVLSALSPSSSTSSSTDEDDPASPVLSLPVSQAKQPIKNFIQTTTTTTPSNHMQQASTSLRRPEFMPRSRLNVYGMSSGGGGGSANSFASKAIIEEDEEEE